MLIIKHKLQFTQCFILSLFIIVFLLILWPVLGYSQIIFSEGPKTATMAVNDGTGNIAWIDTSNTTLSDDVYTIANGLNNNQKTDRLIFSGFGFNIPSDAIIERIEVTVERSATKDLKLEEINLVKNGNLVQPHKDHGNWPNADGITMYGGPSDLWVGQAWTPAEINASNFGVCVRVKAKSNNTQFKIDQIKIKIIFLRCPKAGFTFNTVCLGDPTIFTNTSSFAAINASYFWDFGDGTTSTLENPTHTYTAPGTYNVTLQIFTEQICRIRGPQTPQITHEVKVLHCCSQGQAVATGFASTPSGIVLRIIDVRDPFTNAPGTGTNWLAPAFIDPGWTKENLGNIFGIALDTAINFNIYVTATTCYAGPEVLEQYIRLILRV